MKSPSKTLQYWGANKGYTKSKATIRAARSFRDLLRSFLTFKSKKNP